jgi:hypothetical protein
MTQSLVSPVYGRVTMLLTLIFWWQGLKRTYDAGIWHRDVSDGNVLIAEKPSERNRGLLIDLDYAAVKEGYKANLDDPWTVSLLTIGLRE